MNEDWLKIFKITLKNLGHGILYNLPNNLKFKEGLRNDSKNRIILKLCYLSLLHPADTPAGILYRFSDVGHNELEVFRKTLNIFGGVAPSISNMYNMKISPFKVLQEFEKCCNSDSYKQCYTSTELLHYRHLKKVCKVLETILE